MIGFIWRILIGRFTSCRHQWEIIEQNRLNIINHTTGARREKTEFILRCSHCGDLMHRIY
jgi:hypothetical protein